MMEKKNIALYLMSCNKIVIPARDFINNHARTHAHTDIYLFIYQSMWLYVSMSIYVPTNRFMYLSIICIDV